MAGLLDHAVKAVLDKCSFRYAYAVFDQAVIIEPFDNLQRGDKVKGY